MDYPKKLIVVGMRHIPGALDYIRQIISTPFTRDLLKVNIHLEHNLHASGGQAYRVYLQGRAIGYVREKDLPELKRATDNKAALLDEYCITRVLGEYYITRVEENYLLLELVNTAETSIRKHPNYTDKQKEREVFQDTNALPLSAEIIKQVAINIQNKGKETMFDKIVANNKAVAVNAAYMEAGRIANNQVTKLVAAKAPLMVKGYVDTPVGKVVLANLTAMAVEQFRPTDTKLKKVSVAMMTQAYQELIQTIDIEGMLNELTSSEGIKAALAAVAGQEKDYDARV